MIFFDGDGCRCIAAQITRSVDNFLMNIANHHLQIEIVHRLAAKVLQLFEVADAAISSDRVWRVSCLIFLRESRVELVCWDRSTEKKCSSGNYIETAGRLGAALRIVEFVKIAGIRRF